MEPTKPKYTETFTPSICKPSGETPAAYSGSITIRIPDYVERLELTERAGVDMAEMLEKAINKSKGADDPETADTSGKSKGRQAYEQLKFMARIVPEFVLAVDITRVEDGFKFESWDDLAHDSDASICIMEIGPKILGKYNVGKQQPS
jgi:hypothetical protein